MSSLGGTHHRDTTFTKIFVGGLPYHTSDQTLRSYFEPFGDITEAVVITDRQTGKSRGYGFVTMTDEAAAQRACKDPNPIIDGRKANVNLAYLGAKPRLPVGDILSAAATFPYALKTPGLGLPPAVYPVGDLVGLPQLLYPSAGPAQTAAFLPATAGTQTALAALPQPAAHSPVNAQALAAIGHPLIEYSTLAFAAGPQIHHAAAANFDAYQTAAGAPTAGFLAHSAATPSAGFTPIGYAAPPTPVSAGGIQLGHHHLAHFRPLSIQDRM